MDDSGCEGLKAITVTVIQQDPMCGHLFVLCNRARNRIKMLWWDGTGFYIAAKRMRRGGFDFPQNTNAVSRMSLQQLMLCSKVSTSRTRLMQDEPGER